MKFKVQSQILQAKHNEKLLEILTNESVNDFFDWKITILFYTALHYVKAYSYFNNIEIGESHFEMMENINPNSKIHKLPFPKNIYYNYQRMYFICHESRYSGMKKGIDFNEKLKGDFEICLSSLYSIKDYLILKGLSI